MGTGVTLSVDERATYMMKTGIWFKRIGQIE